MFLNDLAGQTVAETAVILDTEMSLSECQLTRSSFPIEKELGT